MDLFRIGFIRFGVVDLIDVSVVSFIFYKLLSLMKGTRSANIVMGLILVFVISFLAFWFRLDAVMWMFTNLATVGFIVLVVVFQPELRSALAQIGHSRIFRVFFNLEEQRKIDEIVKAAQRLSELKYGGLIVIERNVGLRNIIETGKGIKSQLSAELLTTLFTPYTPLHDGAVVVRGDLIAAAACTLPLTKEPRYMRIYGMRHKAGIGITEESDAVAVIISEETGEISLAANGTLYPKVEKFALKDHIMKLLK
jgi:diadenylate cyclase